MNRADTLRREFADVPAMRHFRLELVSCGDGAAEIRMPARDDHLQLGGVVHGGVISTLADTAAVYTVYPDLADGEMMTSIEFKLNFLHASTLAKGPLTGRARLVRRGKRVAVSEAEVLQGDEVIAKGIFTYLLFRP